MTQTRTSTMRYGCGSESIASSGGAYATCSHRCIDLANARLARPTRRRERDEARQANRIPTLPLPDVRFEQSYLLSVQREPFYTLCI